MKRPPRIGWVREVSILLPLVTLLLVLVSTVTLLSYRGAIQSLTTALPEAAANPSGELARQELVIQRLTWVVVSVNVALTLLVLLFLRHLVRPFETLMKSARGVAEPTGDETEFLLATFERAMAVLASRGREEPDEQEIGALQRALGSSLDSGVVLIDQTDRVLAVNPVAVELLGLPPAPDDRPAVGDYFADHASLVAVLREVSEAGKGVSRREIEVASTGAEPLTLGLTAHLLRRDDGTARGVLALFVDLTLARRQADE